MHDTSFLIEMYEKMRIASTRSSNTTKGRHWFGKAVLENKGLLAWVTVCNDLSPSESKPQPFLSSVSQTDREIDDNDELKNILTQMAMKIVEGALDVRRI